MATKRIPGKVFVKRPPGTLTNKLVRRGYLSKKIGEAVKKKERKLPPSAVNKAISDMRKKGAGEKKLNASDSTFLKEALFARTQKKFKKVGRKKIS